MTRLGWCVPRFAIALVVLGVSSAILPMEWIETSLGFAPDGGRGGLEAGISAVLIGAGTAMLWAVRAVRSARTPTLPQLADERGGA